MTREEIYDRYLGGLKSDLINKYDSLGLRASGEYAEQLAGESEISEERDRLTMWGVDYSLFMEKGRKAGGHTPVADLERWIEVKKGLPGDWKKKKEQIARAIARKHYLQGVKVPNRFNEGGVISDPVDHFLEKAPLMIEEVGAERLGEVRSDILGILKSE